MKYSLCCDIGSTFTKITAVDCNSTTIIAHAQAFTTIENNVMHGFIHALSDISKKLELHALADICKKYEASQNIKKHMLDEIKTELGSIFKHCLAASSAAGGLKMVSCGLVPDLTAKASRLAAASAGAKVMKTYSYELTCDDIQEISQISPDIILLSGGIDGGNRDVLLRNAASIAAMDGTFCVIIAGNRSAANEAGEIIRHSSNTKRAIICENVMPEFGKLNIEPAKNAIRELFIQNIISAKGLDDIQYIMSSEIIPTPLAVFNAAQLLSEGIDNNDGFEKGLGPLMIYDVGGATTDVYSMSDGLPKNPHVYVQGLIEPFAKRTVEGDIGMRYSLFPMMDAINRDGKPFFDMYSLTSSDVAEWLEVCKSNPAALPTDVYSHHKKTEQAFVSEAIRLSAARHVGFFERAFTPAGETVIQTGKDLTLVNYVVGTGGALIGATDPNKALEFATYHPRDLNLLKPKNPQFLLDSEYCLSAMGLLAQVLPRIALQIMKKCIYNEG